MQLFGNLIESVNGVLEWFLTLEDRYVAVFADVDFTILYDWLPSDVQFCITGVLVILFVLCIVGLIKKFVVFFG